VYNTPPYSATNILSGASFGGNNVIGTNTGTAFVTSSGGNSFLTMDLTGKSATWVADLTMLAYPGGGVDMYWGIPTVSNGTLVAHMGKADTTFGIQAGLLSGGATAASSISGSGTWTVPAGGDIIRVSKTSTTTVTIQVKHAGTWGNTATITLTGGALTNTYFALGLNGQAISNITIVPTVAEYAKTWSLVTQPGPRIVLNSAAPGTHDATSGRFFINPGSIPANSATALAYTLINKHVVPGSRIIHSIVHNGTQTMQGISLEIREIGWGMFRMYLTNNTNTAFTPYLTIAYKVEWPISLTP